VAYRITFTPEASREFSSLPKDVQRRIDPRILALADNPWPPGSKKLKGMKNLHRIRIGDYRVVYQVQSDVLLVLVVRIGHRREIYR
jgi:mRNA interferase RelE/StbE